MGSDLNYFSLSSSCPLFFPFSDVISLPPHRPQLPPPNTQMLPPRPGSLAHLPFLHLSPVFPVAPPPPQSMLLDGLSKDCKPQQSFLVHEKPYQLLPKICQVIRELGPAASCRLPSQGSIWHTTPRALPHALPRAMPSSWCPLFSLLFGLGLYHLPLKPKLRGAFSGPILSP